MAIAASWQQSLCAPDIGVIRCQPRPQHDVVLYSHAARIIDLGSDDAISPNDDVVADLDLIVDLQAFAGRCIAKVAAIDSRVGTEFGIVSASLWDSTTIPGTFLWPLVRAR